MGTPDFLLVGAAKSGTSSLDKYLSQHPDIFIPAKKEAHFFSTPDFPDQFTGPGDEGMNRYTLRSWQEYQSLFDKVHNHKAVGESSVFYLYYPGTAERIVRTIPKARILILLRNPVDRAYSAYMHLVRDGRETLDFEQSLALEAQRKASHYEPMWLYKELGMYSGQVRQYLKHFDRRAVKVVLFEEFVRDPQSAMEQIFDFLGVDTDVHVDTGLRVNESGVPKLRWVYEFIARPHPLKELIKPLFSQRNRERLGARATSLVLQKQTMSQATRDELTQYFAADIHMLEYLLDRDLSIWRQNAGTSATAGVDGAGVRDSNVDHMVVR